MAINYASKYSSLVDERFKMGALTAGLLNNNYDWIGVETVVVYGIPTASLTDYTLTGSSGMTERCSAAAATGPASILWISIILR